MIVTSVRDSTLCAAIRRAARADEDVVARPGALVEAVQFGFPRLVVQRAGELRIEGADGPLATVELSAVTVGSWRESWRREVIPRHWVEHAAAQLAVHLAEPGPVFVDETLRDLSRLAGRALPPSLTGLARRVLEFPSAYVDIGALARLTGLSAGALKARFRRRGLPSPFSYLRWLRCLAVAALLQEGRSVTGTAWRLGWTNSGNLCRHVATTVGGTPSALARDGAWETLLVRFSTELLAAPALDEWDELGALFRDQVA
jgi:AraC-like DNA-binding protein